MPLLTDDMIEKAKRGEQLEGAPLEGQDTIRIETRPNKEQHTPIVKSRRIENAKRAKWQSKLNMVLFIVIVLVAILFYLVFH